MLPVGIIQLAVSFSLSEEHHTSYGLPIHLCDG